MSSEINVDYINEVLNETVDDDDKQNLPEDWEEGLTFTARSSRKYTDISFCRHPLPPQMNSVVCDGLWLLYVLFLLFRFYFRNKIVFSLKFLIKSLTLTLLPRDVSVM